MTSQFQIINKILQTKDYSFITLNNLTVDYFFNYKAESSQGLYNNVWGGIWQYKAQLANHTGSNDAALRIAWSCARIYDALLEYRCGRADSCWRCCNRGLYDLSGRQAAVHFAFRSYADWKHCGGCAVGLSSGVFQSAVWYQ